MKRLVNIYPGLRMIMSYRNHGVDKLSEVLGISPDSVRRRLKGEVQFELREIKKLMKLYNCTFSQLFDDEGKDIA